MKKIITLCTLFLCLTALGVNITNYPLTNDFSGHETFLLSSIPQQTNFNLPGNYVAKTSDLNSASNSILSQVPTNLFLFANGGIGTNITLYGTSGRTNWTTTAGNGWLNTNTQGGSVVISNGTVTASSGFYQGVDFIPYNNDTRPVTLSNQLTVNGALSASGLVSGNGAGLSNVINATSAGTINGLQALTNGHSAAVTISNTVAVFGSSTITNSSAANQGMWTTNNGTNFALVVSAGNLNTMFISNQNVGIGGPTPQKTLSVYGTIGLANSPAGGAVKWNIDGGTDYTVTENAVAERLRIKGTSGSMGLGTTSPNAKYDIYSSAVDPALKISGLYQTNIFVVNTNGAVTISGTLTATNGFSDGTNWFTGANVLTNGHSAAVTLSNIFAVNSSGVNSLMVSNGQAFINAIPNGDLINYGRLYVSGNGRFSGFCEADQGVYIGTTYKIDITGSTFKFGATTNASLSALNGLFLGNVQVSSTLTATNGYFNVPANNSVYSGSAVSPLGNWGFLSAYGAGPFATLGSANVYSRITNWVYAVTNQFGAAMTNGYLTNVTAGWYRIGFSVSGAGGNSDQLEADLATNDVTTDLIAAHCGMPNPAKDGNMAGSGILYLPAGTSVSLQIKNQNSTTLTLTHAQLTLGSP